MKFTNKGRQPKDNSRRKGVIPARQHARRQGALNRFTILPFDQWHAKPPCSDERCGREAYDAYVARKNVELDSLKASLNAA